MPSRVAWPLGCEGVRAEQLASTHALLAGGRPYCSGIKPTSFGALLASQGSQMSAFDPLGIKNFRAVGRDHDQHGTAGQPKHSNDRPDRLWMNGCLRLFSNQW